MSFFLYSAGIYNCFQYFVCALFYKAVNKYCWVLKLVFFITVCFKGFHGEKYIDKHKSKTKQNFKSQRTWEINTGNGKHISECKTVAQWNQSLYNKTYSEKSDRIPWLMRMRREYCRVNMWRAPVDFKPNIFESCQAKTSSRQSVESKWILWIMLKSDKCRYYNFFGHNIYIYTYTHTHTHTKFKI